jgi:hypothetical protein
MYFSCGQVGHKRGKVACSSLPLLDPESISRLYLLQWQTAELELLLMKAVPISYTVYMVVYPGSAFKIFFTKGRQDRQTGQKDEIDRQTERHKDRQTDKQTDRKKDRQDRQGRKPDRQRDNTQMTGGQTADRRTGRQRGLRGVTCLTGIRTEHRKQNLFSSEHCFLVMGYFTRVGALLFRVCCCGQLPSSQRYCL